MTTAERRLEVIRYITRIIDYGKGGYDAELGDMSLGEIADQIIALATDVTG